MLEHRIPDVVSTTDLPVRLAAEIDFLAGRVDDDPCGKHTPAVAARHLVLLGRLDDARQALADIDIDRSPPADLAAAAWAASRVATPTDSTASALLARLSAEPSEFIDQAVPVGPRGLYTGVLRAARGDLAGAVDDLTPAVAVGDARAPLWGALCRLELGRVLGTAAAVPIVGAPPAAPYLIAAQTFFAAGGYNSLLARVEQAGGPVPAAVDAGRPGRVGFGVQPTLEVRPSKGLIAIAHLVANDHRVVTAAELACVLDRGDPSSIIALASETWAPDDNGLEVDAGDATATIRAVLFDDTTRSRVSKLLRRTISGLCEVHTLVGAHLEASIATGYACRYRPAGAPVSWTVDQRR